MLGLKAISAPLYRATVARIAQAAAGARSGGPSSLQRLRRQDAAFVTDRKKVGAAVS